MGMPEYESEAGVVAEAASGGFFENAVCGALARMRRGALELTFPGGEVRRFGEPRHRGPVARIRIDRQVFFKKCVLRGDIGFAESYLDGDWHSPDLREVIAWFILNADTAPSMSGSAAKYGVLGVLRLADRVAHLLRRNTRSGAAKNIRDHYDLSNEFFALWLDPSMMYSSALFTRADLTLAEAQREKLDRICRKLRLRPGDTVLEIGCGWGGFALHAAREYGVKVTGLTLSPAQAEMARTRAKAAGLESHIEIRIEDFRDHRGSYDKLVSIEMMEALGHANHPVFAQACGDLLKPDGLMLLQYITCAESRYDELRGGVDFIQKHIFPGSLLLSHNRVSTLLAERGGFDLADYFDLTPHYAVTLRCWRDRFESEAGNVRELGFDDRFLRKWRYYLNYCEAAFESRHIGVTQALYARPNNPLLAGRAC